MLQESFAGSKAMANSSPELRDLLKSGGIPPVPKGPRPKSGILTALQQSTAILQSKGQPERDGSVAQ